MGTRWLISKPGESGDGVHFRELPWATRALVSHRGLGGPIAQLGHSWDWSAESEGPTLAVQLYERYVPRPSSATV